MYEDISVGDEVIIRGQIPNAVGVVTYNSAEHFCYMLPNGISYHCVRSYAKPEKTGVHYESVRSLLWEIKNRGWEET